MTGAEQASNQCPLPFKIPKLLNESHHHLSRYKTRPQGYGRVENLMRATNGDDYLLIDVMNL